MRSIRVYTVSLCSHNGWQPSTVACLECARSWAALPDKRAATVRISPGSPLHMLTEPHHCTVVTAIVAIVAQRKPPTPKEEDVGGG